MTIIETILVWVSAFFGALGLVAMFVAATISLFKIDEADRHFGKLCPVEARLLKGLPFSFIRMTMYGLLILFWKTKIVRRFFLKGGNEITSLPRQAPKKLNRMLVSLYTSWVFCGIIAILGTFLCTLIIDV